MEFSPRSNAFTLSSGILCPRPQIIYCSAHTAKHPKMKKTEENGISSFRSFISNHSPKITNQCSVPTPYGNHLVTTHVTHITAVIAPTTMMTLASLMSCSRFFIFLGSALIFCLPVHISHKHQNLVFFLFCLLLCHRTHSRYRSIILHPNIAIFRTCVIISFLYTSNTFLFLNTAFIGKSSTTP